MLIFFPSRGKVKLEVKETQVRHFPSPFPLMFCRTGWFYLPFCFIMQGLRVWPAFPLQPSNSIYCLLINVSICRRGYRTINLVARQMKIRLCGNNEVFKQWKSISLRHFSSLHLDPHILQDMIAGR